MNRKSDHVLAESRIGHDGTHMCHGGCGKSVAPALWGCKPCWYRLPQHLRNKIWKSYRPGQEIDKRPSPAYIEAAEEVQQWIRANPLPQSPTTGKLF